MSIVTIPWLQSAMAAPDSKVVLIETTWIEKGEGYKKYLKNHLPKARFFDMWAGVNSTQTRPRELADVKEFEKEAQRLGINNDSHVVIHDQGKVHYGVRLWFTFKAFGFENVSVLDGGKVYWETQKLPMETGEPAPAQVGNVQLKPNSGNFLQYDDIVTKIQKHEVQFIDTRHPDYFEGKKDDLPPELSSTFKYAGLDPLDPDSLQKGHFPGAVNLYYPRFTDPETRCFITKEKLQEIMAEIGIDVKKPVISTCYLGVTACFLPLTMSTLLGKQDQVQVFLGSWTEFSQKAPSEMIEKGPARKPSK